MKAPFALVVVAAAMLAPALTHAQVKQPIYVDCKTEDGDEIGKGLCSSLRDVIAKSPRYALLTSPGMEFHSVISIVSVSIGAIGSGHSASSVVFGYAVGAGSMSFLTHEVIVTGLQRIDVQAAGLLVDLDTLIDSMLKKATP